MACCQKPFEFNESVEFRRRHKSLMDESDALRPSIRAQLCEWTHHLMDDDEFLRCVLQQRLQASLGTVEARDCRSRLHASADYSIN